MIYKIKHISCIALVLPTKSVFKHYKTCRTQHTQISMVSLCPWATGQLPNAFHALRRHSCM